MTTQQFSSNLNFNIICVVASKSFETMRNYLLIYVSDGIQKFSIEFSNYKEIMELIIELNMKNKLLEFLELIRDMNDRQKTLNQLLVFSVENDLYDFCKYLYLHENAEVTGKFMRSPINEKCRRFFNYLVRYSRLQYKNHEFYYKFNQKHLEEIIELDLDFMCKHGKKIGYAMRIFKK